MKAVFGKWIPWRTTETLLWMMVLLVTGCDAREWQSPTGPPPPPSQSPPVSSGTGGIGGYVFAERNGNCLIGAKVEVLDSPFADAVRPVQQNECPFGDAYGYEFLGFPTDHTVRVRASAAGYLPSETRVQPTQMVPQTNFILMRAPDGNR